MLDIQLQPLTPIAALRADASSSEAQTRCCKHAPTSGGARVESANALPKQRDAAPCMSLDGFLTAARIASGM